MNQETKKIKPEFSNCVADRVFVFTIGIMKERLRNQPNIDKKFVTIKTDDLDPDMILEIIKTAMTEIKEITDIY